MATASLDNKVSLPSTPWGLLPPRMRVLFVTGPRRAGEWLAQAFAADSASDIALDEAVGIAAGVARLRDEAYDAVLISHDPENLNALELLDAIRAGSSDDQPIVVLGDQSEQEMAALCYEAGGDAYVCVKSATTRALIWTVARAIERHRLIGENRRLQQLQQRRIQLEHDEALRLLDQQRGMIADLEQLSRESPATASGEIPPTPLEVENPEPLPDALVEHYRELLRAYVIMGTGNLADEMHRLAALLASAGMNASEAMQLHLKVVEEMLEGLGSRSARHVMNRADMLVLEVMINLAESYRLRKLQASQTPHRQAFSGLHRGADSGPPTARHPAVRG